MPFRDYLEGLCRWEHRGSTTENERRAAEYIRGQMASIGLDSRVEHFVSHTSFSWVYLIIFAGLFLAGWLGWRHPYLGTVLCVTMIALFYGECTSRWKALSHVLPKRASQNVSGVLRNDTARKKVVFLAHYDSSRSGLSFHPSLVGSFRRSFIMSFAMMIILAEVLLVRCFGGGGKFLYLARFVATAYMLVPIVLLLHREIFGHFVQGAADNASGVASMLTVAERLAEGPPRDLEAWFLATGCEEVNLMGMISFMKAHGYDLNPIDTYFINFDNLGKGTLRYVISEGMLTEHHSSLELVCIAQNIASSEEFSDARPHRFKLGAFDVLVATTRGYKTISLIGLDMADEIPHWHWSTDTLENVDASLGEKAADFALAMTSALDS